MLEPGQMRCLDCSAVMRDHIEASTHKCPDKPLHPLGGRHASGPWRVLEKHPAVVLGAQGYPILIAHQNVPSTPEGLPAYEAYANARLASKAPELLRALERAHGLLDLLLYAKTLPHYAETEAFHAEIRALCEAARGLR